MLLLSLFCIHQLLYSQCPNPIVCGTGSAGDKVDVTLGGMGGNQIFATFDYTSGKITFNKPLEINNQSGSILSINNIYGYVKIGTENSSWAHIYTDRNNFYINKDIHIATGGISSYSTSNLYLKTGGTTRMTILNSNGKIGIGTSSPVGKLEIVSSGTIGSGNDLNWNNAAIRINQSPYLLGLDGNQIVCNNELNLCSEAVDGFINFVVYNNNHVMRILSNGNVGIGNINPSSKLTVNGDILCEKVKCIADVPYSDYVFEKGYKLPSLELVEDYIDQNKHLPDVPSKYEFEQNGMDLMEMNILLLKKVEEQMLYIINLNDRIKALENQLSSIEK